jgi:ribosomal protein S18 acetylase RimI-like enzyme
VNGLRRVNRLRRLGKCLGSHAVVALAWGSWVNRFITTMQLARLVDWQRYAGHAEWLPPSAAPEINAVLDAAFPDSYARPGTCWAGVRDPRTGRLAATAALAWCAPTVGYIAGVATAPAARGQGLGRDACALVIAEALATDGTAALIVADDNTAAVSLYRALGLTYRPLGAAGIANAK